jgi:hypothetical protein
MLERHDSEAKAVACAAEAVKGLRSQSLAPMNASREKHALRALDCLPRFGWEVYKGSCAPRLKTAMSTILWSCLWANQRGEVQLRFSKN